MAHIAPDVVLVGDLAHDDAVGQLDVDGEQLGLADHDRLGLVGDEAVGDEGLVQAGGVVVAAGLPLDPADLGHGRVVGQGLLDQPATDSSVAGAPSASRLR